LHTVASASEETDRLDRRNQPPGRANRRKSHTKAVDEARRQADTIVRALAEGAEKIGAVVGLITNIAQPDQPAAQDFQEICLAIRA